LSYNHAKCGRTERWGAPQGQPKTHLPPVSFAFKWGSWPLLVKRPQVCNIGVCATSFFSVTGYGGPATRRLAAGPSPSGHRPEPPFPTDEPFLPAAAKSLLSLSGKTSRHSVRQLGDKLPAIYLANARRVTRMLMRPTAGSFPGHGIGGLPRRLGRPIPWSGSTGLYGSGSRAWCRRRYRFPNPWPSPRGHPSLHLRR
jgi:hypothetical protein